MKQNWEKKFDKKWLSFHYGDTIDVKIFISKLINQTKQEEREGILKALPKKRTGVDFEPIKGEWNDGFNLCLEQIKDIINKL